ncbi:N-acetylglucosamine-6-phosphate deacetylase [Streptomyces sp. MN03-5084-2B]|nr:N-acetylglucosamine-6-phosphate deacetylase [Streptomyces sp. MN03-5084-2B]
MTAVGLAGPGSGIAVPGLVDLQVNGFGGVDFLNADVEAYGRANAALARTGVVAYQPTLITSRPEQTVAALETAAKAQAVEGGARILGVHLEGPFLSAERPGTHPVDLLRDPDPDLLQRLLVAGPVTQVTLAPELLGALEVIGACVAAGVLVACGHSDATAAEAHAAFDRGARSVTHLFDAMRPFTHRDPGIAGVALTRDEVYVGLIADPSHVGPEAVQLAFHAARDRVVLVTDALAPAGCPDGHYRLGDVEFDVAAGTARRADGTLVGTTITLLEAIRDAHAAGVPLEAAANAATRTPARLFPASGIGLLRPGDRADVVVLDDALNLRTVLLGGAEPA